MTWTVSLWEDFDQYDTSSLRTGIMVGSPCPMEVMKKVVDVMGANEITIAYCQTESSPVITQTRTDDPLELRVSSVGRKLPDEKYGEQIAAAVKPRSGANLTAEDVQEYCRENIAHFKVPRYVDFVESYPMTASGKIQKYKLRETAVERYDLREAASIETA